MALMIISRTQQPVPNVISRVWFRLFFSPSSLTSVPPIVLVVVAPLSSFGTLLSFEQSTKYTLCNETYARGRDVYQRVAMDMLGARQKLHNYLYSPGQHKQQKPSSGKTRRHTLTNTRASSELNVVREIEGAISVDDKTLGCFEVNCTDLELGNKPPLLL